jgi:hypothetical protein
MKLPKTLKYEQLADEAESTKNTYSKTRKGGAIPTPHLPANLKNHKKPIKKKR